MLGVASFLAIAVGVFIEFLFLSEFYLVAHVFAFRRVQRDFLGAQHRTFGSGLFHLGLHGDGELVSLKGHYGDK